MISSLQAAAQYSIHYHTSLVGHLSRFHILATVLSAAQSEWKVYICPWEWMFLCLWIGYQEMKLLGCMQLYSFMRNLHPAFHKEKQESSGWEFFYFFATSLPDCSHLFLIYSHWCEIISCQFDLHFPGYKWWITYFFICLLAIQ